MKNLQKFAFLFATVAMLALSSCGGDEETDPKPATKTNLQLVKEGLLREWEFVSADITKTGTTTPQTFLQCATFLSNNDTDNWAEFNTIKVIKFKFNENGTEDLYDEMICGTTQFRSSNNFTYTVQENTNRDIIITINAETGVLYEFKILNPQSLSTAQFEVERINLKTGASRAVLKFKR